MPHCSGRTRCSGRRDAAILSLLAVAALCSAPKTKSFVQGLRALGAPRSGWRGHAEGPLLAAAAEGEARLKLEDLEPGQELQALVLQTCPIGIFVDVGADRQGFVHISQMSTGFVDDPALLVSTGDMIKVYFDQIDEEGKLRLTMVSDNLEEVDFSEFENLPDDLWMDGTVLKVQDFGAIVLAGPPGGKPAKGFVHLSQMTDVFVDHPAELVEAGQEVRVRMLPLREGGLRFSMKEKKPERQFTPRDQDVSALVDVPETWWHMGRVKELAPFGCFVELTGYGKEGKRPVGLVHVTEMSEKNRRIENIEDEVTVGDEVKCRIVSVDKNSGRLSLSFKIPGK